MVYQLIRHVVMTTFDGRGYTIGVAMLKDMLQPIDHMSGAKIHFLVLKMQCDMLAWQV
jgi:hypothetical protein